MQQLMNEQGIDRLVLGPTANMFYLTGLATVPDERVQVVVVPDEGFQLSFCRKCMGRKLERERVLSLLLWSDHRILTNLFIRRLVKEHCALPWTHRCGLDISGVMGRSKQSEFIDAQAH